MDSRPEQTGPIPTPKRRAQNVAMLFIGHAAGMPDLAAFLPPFRRRPNAAERRPLLPQP
ncbi:hypothetical protein GGR38_003528 [Novosphingobium sediminicola]|uniref:Uncharacterized protein n=1 Tax=Novosphingobium sediminicola TaxID=563162 RepID=A0A7W6G7N6_9SPHN|nr:hypothetical protein [Novosphingobium sediminicola]